MSTETAPNTPPTAIRPKYTGPRLVPIVALQNVEPMRQADGETVRAKDDNYKGPNRFFINVIDSRHHQKQMEATQSAWKSVTSNRYDRKKGQHYVLTMNTDGIVADIAVKHLKGFGMENPASSTPGEPCVIVRQYADNTASVTNKPEKTDPARIDDIVSAIVEMATNNQTMSPGQLLLERYRVVRVSREVGHVDWAIDPMPSA